MQNWPDGHLKLAWTRHLLKLRAELADVFTHGDYQPLEVTGPHRDHVIAFARRHGGDAAIAAVTKTLGAIIARAAGPGRARMSLTALSISQAIRVEGMMPANCRSRSCSRHLPVAVLKAKTKGAAPAKRKRTRA